jgi:alpha-L-fucosidase 2
MEILHDLFGYYLQAAEELGVRSPMLAKVKAARAQLVPPQIGSSGALQEWADDWQSLEKNHRHFSHLYGLYPGRVLWDKRTPQLIEAYKKVLEERGDGGMGWSMAWKMALWARLGDGNRAYKIFKQYLRDQNCEQLFAKCGKAMQVDGTLGATAAITEMLMQTHEGYIHLLPALPDAWKSGEFRGVCARGGFELDFKWVEGKVTEIKLLSKAGEVCRIRVERRTCSSRNRTSLLCPPECSEVGSPAPRRAPRWDRVLTWGTPSASRSCSWWPYRLPCPSQNPT